MHDTVSKIRAYYHSDLDKITGRLEEFLAIPSISAFSEYLPECERCAAWVAKELSDLGFEIEMVDTGYKPLVFARSKSESKDAPTVLFYGHYDVQPVDNDWSSNPFELTNRDGRFFARGAQDNKGQIMYVLSALRALKDSGSELPNLKFLIEGEEESGSKGIAKVLPELADRIKADYLLVCDSTSPEEGVGCLTLSLRGYVKMKLSVRGPKTELHSGHHGGYVMNPLNALQHAMGSLIGEDGTGSHYECKIPGFYDGAALPPRELIEAAAHFDPDLDTYLRQTGVPPAFGDPALSFTERTGLRPSIDIHNTHSGWGKEGDIGFKTAIPASAEAYFSIRYVSGQDPEALFRATKSFLEAHFPPGVSFNLENLGYGMPLMLSPGSPGFDEAKRALETVGDGGKAAIIFGGGSIPIVSSLIEHSGASPILFGFGTPEDNIHGTDESFSWVQFEKGMAAIATFLTTLKKR